MSRLESEDGNDVDNDADANSDEPVTTLARLAATLRSWRYAVYVGGLVVVTLGARVGPEWARTPLVVLTLTVMGGTYLAELRGRADEVSAGVVVTALALVGVAVGSYLAVEVNRLGGALFVLGGVLLFRAAARGPTSG